MELIFLASIALLVAALLLYADRKPGVERFLLKIAAGLLVIIFATQITNGGFVYTQATQSQINKTICDTSDATNETCNYSYVSNSNLIPITQKDYATEAIAVLSYLFGIYLIVIGGFRFYEEEQNKRNQED